MTTEQRKGIVEDLFSKAIGVITEKGNAYSGNEDTLSNFKVIAGMTGSTKYEVWAVYFMKHILAITNSIKQNPDYPVEKTEGMDGRIMDAINYLTILQCLVEEDSNDGRVLGYIDEDTKENGEFFDPILKSISPYELPEPKLDRSYHEM